MPCPYRQRLCEGSRDDSASSDHADLAPLAANMTWPRSQQRGERVPSTSDRLYEFCIVLCSPWIQSAQFKCSVMVLHPLPLVTCLFPLLATVRRSYYTHRSWFSSLIVTLSNGKKIKYLIRSCFQGHAYSMRKHVPTHFLQRRQLQLLSSTGHRRLPTL